MPDGNASAGAFSPPTMRPLPIRDIERLIAKLKRRRVLIACVTVLLTAVCAIGLFLATPRYTAHTAVMLDPRLSRVINVEAVLSGLPADLETIQSEVQVIRSVGLAERVIIELDLEHNPEFNPELAPPFYAALYGTLARFLPPDFIAVLPAPPPPAPAHPPSADAKARVFDRFMRKLQVSLAGRSRVINIDFESSHPELAAKVASAIADAYVVSQLDRKFEATATANRWLDGQLADLRAQVEQAERNVETYRAKWNLVRGKDSSVNEQAISEVNTQLVLARTQRSNADARLRQLQAAPASDKTQAIPEVLNNVLIQTLRAKEAESEQRLAQLASQYGERYPRYLDAKADLQDIRRKIGIEIEKIVRALRDEVALQRSREALLNEQLEKLKVEAAQQNTAGVELSALERDAEANRRMYEAFLGRSKETALQGGIQQPDASVISRAVPPLTPSFPQKRVLLPIAAVGALGLAVALALALELRDKAIRSMDEIEEELGAPALGFVPLIRRSQGNSNDIVREITLHPTSAFSEAVRTLAICLGMGENDNRPKTLLVTSSLPGEGKTTIAAGLALEIASMRRRVVLVDCDIRRPRAHAVLDISASPGLVEYLAARAKLEDVIVKDALSGVCVVPAGRMGKETPATLISAQRIGRLVNILTQSFDVVVLDSAPILAVADTRSLTRFADQTVVVAHWGLTTKQTLYRALKTLTDGHGRVAGVALNMMDPKAHAGYGYTDAGLYHAALKTYYVR